MVFLAGFLCGIAFSLIISALSRYASSHAYDQGPSGGDRSDPQRAGSSVTGTDAPSLEIEISIEEWVNKGWVNRQGGW